MPFVDSSDSLRAKLHVSDVSLPALVGVVACALLAVVLVGVHVAGVLGAGDVVVERQDKGGHEDEQKAEETPAAPERVKVHVDGCVACPGVYEVDKGARVQDAVDLAGGLSEQADSAAVNLAREVSDGEQVLVPAKGQAAGVQAGQAGASSTLPSSSGAASAGAAAASGAASASQGLVNINTADEQALQTLPGVGASTAAKIVESRKSEGPFASKEDLKRVSGIGDKKYQKLQGRICV